MAACRWRFRGGAITRACMAAPRTIASSPARTIPTGWRCATLEGQQFLAMNGVQTLSDSYACADHQIELLRDAGVSRLRLSPQTGDFAAVCALYRARLDGTISRGGGGRGACEQAYPGIRLSDGFLTGASGAEWSGAQIWREG